jgi:hypothetical protein
MKCVLTRQNSEDHIDLIRIEAHSARTIIHGAGARDKRAAFHAL